MTVLALSALCGAGQELVDKGDFEGYEGERLLGWGSEGDIPFRARTTGGWFLQEIRFNTGDYQRIQLYLRLQSGKGNIWFDAVSAPELELANPGFEEAEEGRFAGWGQDDVGEFIFFGEEGSFEGNQCAAIIEPGPDGIHRIWQDVACEPQTDYLISFAMKTSGLVGDAYGEVYGLTADGELGAIIGQSTHLTRDRSNELGDVVGEALLEPGKRALLTQVVKLPGDRNLAASIMVCLRDAPNAKAGLRIVILPEAEGGEARPLAELIPDPEQGPWQHLGVWLETKAEGEARVEVFAEGDGGVVLVDNVSVRDAVPDPRPITYRPLPASQNWTLPDELTVHLDWAVPNKETKLEHTDGGPVIRSAFDLLGEALGGKKITLVSQAIHAGGHGHMHVGEEGEHEDEHPADIHIMVRTPPAATFPKAEEFGMSIHGQGARVHANSPLGVLTGLMGLANLVTTDGGGRQYALGAVMQDKPDTEFRGTYIAASPRLTDELRTRLRQFARLRLTHVMFESADLYRLDDPAVLEQAVECFEYCRGLGLEPIPELQSFGWAHLILAIDPNVGEGTFVENEELTLTGVDPAALAHPNVLRTEATDIVVTSADGAVTYEAGRDYRVIAGVTQHVFRPDAEPFRLARLPEGRLRDGATVRASYDYASRVDQNNYPYCPSEPRVYAIMEQALQLVIEHLKPRYLHIGHDEPALMNSDSRCRKRALTNGQLMAEDIKWFHATAKKLDPNVRLMMWADALNPFHNGLMFGDDPTAAAAELIPQDIVQCVWFYGSSQPATLGFASLKHFGDLGFQTTGSPWDDIECNLQWADVCYAARQRGHKCLGGLYTSWDNRWDGLETFAEAHWRVPRRLTFGE